MDGQCSGVTRLGARCRARALPGSAWCISHDPARVVELTEYRRQGGRAKSSAARAKKKILAGGELSPAEIGAALGKALTDVLRGELDPKIANAASNLSRSIVAVREATIVEERLAALEAALERSQTDERRYA